MPPGAGNGVIFGRLPAKSALGGKKVSQVRRFLQTCDMIRPSGHKKHLVFDRTDGKSVLTVKTVTVGMSKSHGITLFTLMPFNSIFAT